MTRVTIEAPDCVDAEEVRLAAALKLWEEERISTQQAAEMLGVTKEEFLEYTGAAKAALRRPGASRWGRETDA